MAPQPGSGVGGGYSLRFYDLSATDLPETETWPFGKQDPYVKLSLPNKPVIQSTVVSYIYIGSCIQHASHSNSFIYGSRPSF
jgi:hypothetical protein